MNLCRKPDEKISLSSERVGTVLSKGSSIESEPAGQSRYAESISVGKVYFRFV